MREAVYYAKFQQLQNEIKTIIRDFKMELALRDAKIEELRAEINQHHVILTNHWNKGMTDKGDSEDGLY